ncbi:hypothetical protein FPRO04_14599 [Fusarium proliferatum]|nr:hypothetical protein FPRO04_14599 [Fusarium proliferatum]
MHFHFIISLLALAKASAALPATAPTQAAAPGAPAPTPDGNIGSEALTPAPAVQVWDPHVLPELQRKELQASTEHKLHARQQFGVSKRKNLFTITLQGAHVVVNGLINFSLEAALDTTSRVSTFIVTPLTNSSPRAVASVTHWEYLKDLLGRVDGVRAEVTFTWQAASGTFYKFLGEIVYGLDTRVSAVLEDVQEFTIDSATQQLPGKVATKLVLGSFDDSWKDEL